MRCALRCGTVNRVETGHVSEIREVVVVFIDKEKTAAGYVRLRSRVRLRDRSRVRQAEALTLETEPASLQGPCPSEERGRSKGFHSEGPPPTGIPVGRFERRRQKGPLARFEKARGFKNLSPMRGGDPKGVKPKECRGWASTRSVRLLRSHSLAGHEVRGYRTILFET